MKTAEDNFSDWESNAFGYGYGTGEQHVIPALHLFLCAVPESGAYRYEALESACGAPVAWLLINTLVHQDMIEYGTSPRYGWLTPQGAALRRFVVERTPDALVELTCRDGDYVHCYPNACNCDGYVEGRVCPNPFWQAESVQPPAADPRQS